MKEKSKSLLKNMGILTLSNFASKILAICLVPLYTSILTTAEYGNYDLVYTSINLLLPVLTVNIAEGVLRFSLNKDADSEKNLAVGLRYSLFGCIAVAFLLLLNKLLGLQKFFSDYAFLIFVYFAFFALQELMICYSKGTEHVLDMGIASVIGTAVTLASNILFLLVFKWGLEGFFYANILGCAIPTLYYFLRYKVWRCNLFRYIEPELQRKLVAYSTPLILMTMSWTLNNSLDKYAASFFCGISAMGILAVSYKIPNILIMIQRIFTQAWQISAITEYESSDKDLFYDNVYTYVSTFGSLCCSGLILVGRLIARLLFAKDFYAAWQYVPFLLISVNINSLSGFIEPILLAEMNSKAMVRSAIWGAVANTVLNVMLVWKFGIQGATVATALSSLVIYFIMKTSINKEIAGETCIKAYISWVILTVQAFLEIRFRNYYIGLIFLFVIVVINRKSVFEIVKLLTSQLNKNANS